MSYTGEVPDNDPRRRGPVHRTVQAAQAAISCASALEIAISWSVHHSIIWAIIQGFLSWIYVVWYAVMR